MIHLRDATEQDLPFLIDSWVRSCKTGSKHSKRQVVREQLYDLGASVACWTEDPELIIGWRCSADRILHYVYVKRDYRREGVARLLLGGLLDTAVIYTHPTTRALRRKLPPSWHYDPNWR